MHINLKQFSIPILKSILIGAIMWTLSKFFTSKDMVANGEEQLNTKYTVRKSEPSI